MQVPISVFFFSAVPTSCIFFHPVNHNVLHVDVERPRRRCLRCPLRDVEDEDIDRFFEAAARFINAAAAAGGSALVHCHEGRSRSVTLVLAYLMQTQARPASHAKHLSQVNSVCMLCRSRASCGHCPQMQNAWMAVAPAATNIATSQDCFRPG